MDMYYIKHINHLAIVKFLRSSINVFSVFHLYSLSGMHHVDLNFSKKDEKLVRGLRINTTEYWPVSWRHDGFLSFEAREKIIK